MTQEEFSEIDQEMVNRIVEKMKKKYQKEGSELDVSAENLGELRGIISGERHQELQIQNVEELLDSKSALIRQLGQLYLKLRNPLKPLSQLIASTPWAKTLAFFLYSANLKYSLRQYLALVSSVTVLAFGFGLFLGILTSFLLNINLIGKILITLSLAFFFGLFGMIIMLVLPKAKAEQRGAKANSELPFALRHMAAELKAGIGLFRTIQIIATADYSVLSEEFARTTREIEEGTDAKEALRNMAVRVQSSGLRNAMMHVVRAMKTGGNLSEVMNEIAQDIADEQRNQIREFAEKMNFFGILFIFSGIVFPAMIITMGGIRAAPLPLQIDIPVTPPFIAVLFFVFMPLVLGFLLYYLKNIQPQ